MVLCAQVLDILRAQSADELEEAVSEWTEVRPATAGFALTGKSRALSRFQSRGRFEEMVWRKTENRLRTIFGHRASRFSGEPRWFSDAEACRAQPVNNYMYCDIHGEYGYRLRGKIPIRSNDAGICNPHDHFVCA